MSPKQIANRVACIQPSAVAEMLRLGRDLERQGRKVVGLVQGEPDFDTPQHIKDAVREGLDRGLTRYVPNQGISELREAVAQKLKKDNSIEADPASEILITNGGGLGLYLAIMATVNPGDEVLMVDPTFGNFANVVTLAGGIPVSVPLEKQNGRFCIDRDAIIARITARTKAFIVNSPGNPAGNVMTRAELEGISQVAVGHDIYLISDEVYEKLVFPGHTHYSLASFSPEIRQRTITVNSFSKTYAMTGWRLGYTCAPAEITRAMSNIYQFSARCATAFVQHAGVIALTASQDCVNKMLEEYTRRREVLISLLSEVPGVSCVVPEGTFFAFLDVSSIDSDSWAVSRYLLTDGAVLTSPGAFYGKNGEGSIRLSFATSIDNIKEGIRRIRDSLSRYRRR